jgi:hypothetical protein
VIHTTSLGIAQNVTDRFCWAGGPGRLSRLCTVRYWRVFGVVVRHGDAGLCLVLSFVTIPGRCLGWHHETQNLETPTITATETFVYRGNYKAISEQLHGNCACVLYTWNHARGAIQAHGTTPCYASTIQANPRVHPHTPTS